MIPEVSVVIPTHNRRTMVAQALASVLVQRGTGFELIVVDDGSTDGTAEDLHTLCETNDPVRVISMPHRGPAAARNAGVAAARAELVAFLDSDDLWMAGKLARQRDFMRANPECVISQTQELWIRDGRRVNPGLRHRKRAGDIFVDSLRTCLISPSAAILRTRTLRELGGFDERMAACEDYDLWLRLLLEYDAGLLAEPLVIRRAGHSDQLSATVPALDRFRILALTKLLADSRLCGTRRVAACAVLAEKCRIYAAGLARRGRRTEAEFYRALANAAGADWQERPMRDGGGVVARLAELATSQHFPPAAAPHADAS